jgi:hypothetical protein
LLDLGGSIGFGMTIVDRIPKIYLLVAGVGRQVAHNKEDKLECAMSVQTKLAKVTLSKIPDNLPPETIYGFVEFESKTFYQANHFENGQEVPNQRDAVRINMKIYLKANRDDSLADFQTIFIRNHLNDN